MLTDLGIFEYEFEYLRVPQACRPGTMQLVELDRQATRNFLEEAHGYRLFKTHTHLEWDNLPKHIKFVSVYRDPRDTLVSLVFFLTALGPDAGGYIDEISAWSFKEKLIYEIEKTGYSLLYNLEHWYYHNGMAFQTSYEQMKSDPEGELRRLLDRLGIEASEERIEEAVRWHDFKRRAGRRPGQEDQQSFLRKGISGDWVNYFDEECVARLKSAHSGRWNQLILDMGYEQESNWGLPYLGEVNA